MMRSPGRVTMQFCVFNALHLFIYLMFVTINLIRFYSGEVFDNGIVVLDKLLNWTLTDPVRLLMTPQQLQQDVEEQIKGGIPSKDDRESMLEMHILNPVLLVITNGN